MQNDLSLVPNAVEEILRMATPTANMWRVCTKDTVLGDVEIPAGSMCLLRYAAANRDPAQFADPDRFDVTRANADEHLAFGLGIHFCLGANLARKEMNVAFETLLGRFDHWSLDASQPAPRHRPNMLLWGLESLPLTFQSRSH